MPLFTQKVTVMRGWSYGLLSGEENVEEQSDMTACRRQ